MPHCVVFGNLFPCAGYNFSVAELKKLIAECPVQHPELGVKAFGDGMSLRSHRDYLDAQKSKELKRLEKKLLEMTPEHKSRPTTEKKIADLKVELGVEE